MTEFVAEVRPDAPHVLRVSGEVDIASVDEFLTQARLALRNAATALEIDFDAVTFIDSTGLGALVRIREEALANNMDVQLTHVPRQVSRVLEVTGLSEIFAGRPDD